jgi:hypothetical protein
MLSQIRYEQQYQQLQNAPRSGVSNIAAYGGRDPVTGGRIATDACGGQQIAQYLSNSQPSGVLALSQFSTIGLSGYISQKLH